MKKKKQKSKLTPQDRKEIKKLYRHYSQVRIAKMFKVSQATIQKIVSVS